MKNALMLGRIFYGIPQYFNEYHGMAKLTGGFLMKRRRVYITQV
jgi:hypothetical protein